jgi:single-strand DNA-binding protein
MNKVLLVGRLGSDPELKYTTTTNKAVVNTALATNDAWTDGGGQKHMDIEWHRVTIWGATAEAASKFLRKGSLVMVEGRLKTEKWEKDGQKHYSTDVVATRVLFMDSKGENAPLEGAPRSRRQDVSRSTGTSDGSGPSSGRPGTATSEEDPPF